jgi:ATP-dependent RNA helicase
MAASSRKGRRQEGDVPMEDDLANVEFETSEDVKVVSSFDQMGLKETLLRGIYAYGTFIDSSVNPVHASI